MYKSGRRTKYAQTELEHNHGLFGLILHFSLAINICHSHLYRKVQSSFNFNFNQMLCYKNVFLKIARNINPSAFVVYLDTDCYWQVVSASEGTRRPQSSIPDYPASSTNTVSLYRPNASLLNNKARLRTKCIRNERADIVGHGYP
jgi:hypothetical protein